MHSPTYSGLHGARPHVISHFSRATGTYLLCGGTKELGKYYCLAPLFCVNWEVRRKVKARNRLAASWRPTPWPVLYKMAGVHRPISCFASYHRNFLLRLLCMVQDKLPGEDHGLLRHSEWKADIYVRICIYMHMYYIHIYVYILYFIYMHIYACCSLQSCLIS